MLLLAPCAAASGAADTLVQRLLCGCQPTLTEVVQCQLELIGEESSGRTASEGRKAPAQNLSTSLTPLYTCVD